MVTQEQMAREKAVSGRVQLQVFYHDERHELVVSVLAADDLPSREDTGYGALPEAFLKLRLLPVTYVYSSRMITMLSMNSTEFCSIKNNMIYSNSTPIFQQNLLLPLREKFSPRLILHKTRVLEYCSIEIGSY